MPLLRSVATLTCVIVGAGWSLPAMASPVVSPPPAMGIVDYQLSGGYPPQADVTIVERDRTDVPLAGRYNICYVNGFQTQPGELNWWQHHHNSLLLRKSGRLVVDAAWGEVLLDTSSRRKRSQLARIIGRWSTDCARRGFAAVEFDNLDSFTRSHGRLTAQNNLALARKLVRRSHAVGLATGQKNTPELKTRGRQLAGFDFAIAEECQFYDECSSYLKAYGAQVIDIEYSDRDPSVFADACAAIGGRISVVLRDRLITTPGDPDYRYQHC